MLAGCGDSASMRAQTTEERVQFENAKGEMLAGMLCDPPGSSCAAVLCHGYQSSKNGFHMPALAAALAAKGVASLRFDFSGNGESEGRFSFNNYNGEAEEIRRAVLHLRDQHGKDVVAILGHSKGGSEVILYGSKYNGDPPRIVNVCGRFGMASGITMRFGEDIFERLKSEQAIQMPAFKGGRTWTLTYEDMQERLNLDMATAAASIKHSRVLTIHGTADTTMPIENGYKYHDAIQGSELAVVEGANHNFTEHKEQLISIAVDFITSSEIDVHAPSQTVQKTDNLG